MVGIDRSKASTKPTEDATLASISPDERFAHAPFSLDGVFRTDAPVEVEFGTGKARFLIESGRSHPERRYLGLERSLSYYRLARDRIRKAGLANVFVLRADAAEFAAAVPDESVEAFHAYFLDPWPKKKQKKRRLITADFLSAVCRGTKPGGTLRLATDHAEYAAAIAEAIGGALRRGAPWEAVAWDQGEIPPPTHYELKYLQAGREIFRFQLRRASDGGTGSSATTERQNFWK